jgi:hypothetical protein
MSIYHMVCQICILITLEFEIFGRISSLQESQNPSRRGLRTPATVPDTIASKTSPKATRYLYLTTFKVVSVRGSDSFWQNKTKRCHTLLYVCPMDGIGR